MKKEKLSIWIRGLSVLCCMLYLFLPLLKISDKMLHDVAHFLNNKEVPAHHHHPALTPGSLNHDEGHDHGVHHSAEHNHAPLTSGVGHHHSHEKPAIVPDHEHGVLKLIETWVSFNQDHDDQPPVEIPDLDKHLLFLSSEDEFGMYFITAENFKVKALFTTQFFNKETDPPEA